MYKKITIIILMLIALCGCTTSAKLETYNEYYTLISNFNDKVNESGYQNIKYDASISGAPSLILQSYSYLNATKDNSYIFLNENGFREVYNREDGKMYKYYQSSAGYNKEVASSKDYKDYLFVNDFSIASKFSNKIEKRDGKFEFKMPYKKLPFSFRVDVNKMFSYENLHSKFNEVNIVYEIFEDRLNLSMNIDCDFEVPMYQYTNDVIDYQKEHGTFSIDITVDYKPFEKYLFEDMSSNDNSSSNNLSSINKNTDLFTLFIVSSGNNFFKTDIEKGYYRIISKYDYMFFKVEVYDQNENKLPECFDDFLLENQNSKILRNTFYIKSSGTYYINIISDSYDSIKIESVEMDNFYDEERYPLTNNNESSLNEFDYDLFIHTSEYDNILKITNTKEKTYLFFIDEKGHRESIKYNETFNFYYTKGEVKIALKAYNSDIFIESVYPIEYSFDFEIHEIKNANYAEFTYQEKMIELTEEYTESFFLGYRLTYYFILNTKEAGYYKIVSDVVNSFSEYQLKLSYKNVNDISNQHNQMLEHYAYFEANSSYYIYVQGSLNEIRLKYEYTPCTYIDTQIELNVYSGRFDNELKDIENLQETFDKYVRYHFELNQMSKVKFTYGIVIYNSEGIQIAKFFGDNVSYDYDFAVIELKPGSYYCVLELSKEYSPYLKIALAE